MEARAGHPGGVNASSVLVFLQCVLRLIMDSGDCGAPHDSLHPATAMAGAGTRPRRRTFLRSLRAYSSFRLGPENHQLAEPVSGHRPVVQTARIPALETL